MKNLIQIYNKNTYLYMFLSNQQKTFQPVSKVSLMYYPLATKTRHTASFLKVNANYCLCRWKTAHSFIHLLFAWRAYPPTSCCY